MGLPIIEITDRRTVHRGPVTSQRLRVISLDKLGERLLDANRTIGQPKKITMIFGRKITKHYRGKLQTEIEDMNLPNPVIRSHYGNGFIKQCVRDIDDLGWRIKPARSKSPQEAYLQFED